MTCGTGCGFSDGGNRAADARTRSASIRKLWTAVILCMVFMSVEVVGGIKANSLAILTDAAHLLTDVAGFAISLFAIWASGWEATPRQTYGFFRLEVLGALLSIQLIWLLTGVLIYEAIDRLLHNRGAVDGRLMFIVSTFGLIVNIAMIFLLGHSDHGHDHSHSDSDSHSEGHWHGEGKGHQQQAKHRHAQEHRANTEYDHDHGHRPEDLSICSAAIQDKTKLKKPLISDVERDEHFVNYTNVGETLGYGLRDAESRHLQNTKFKLDRDLEASSNVQKDGHSHLNINVQGEYLHMLRDLVQSIEVNYCKPCHYRISIQRGVRRAFKISRGRW
jgi:zinc transporter 2